MMIQEGSLLPALKKRLTLTDCIFFW